MLVSEQAVKKAQRVLYDTLKKARAEKRWNFEMEFPLIYLPWLEWEVFYGFTMSSKDFACFIFNIKNRGYKRWLNVKTEIMRVLKIASDEGKRGCCVVDVDSIYYIVTSFPVWNRTDDGIVVRGHKGLEDMTVPHQDLYVIPLEHFVRCFYEK